MESTDPTQPERACWRSNPAQWIRENAADLDSAARSLPLALKEAQEVPASLPDALALLCEFRNAQRYGNRLAADARFLGFGPLAIPTNARGLEILRSLRMEAHSLSTGTLERIAEDGSALHRLMEAFDSQAQRKFLLSSGNDTNPSGTGFRFRFRFRPEALISTRGKDLPPALLGIPLEGYELTGSEALEWQSEESACDQGVAEFLDRFGISYSREESECSECGCETGSDGSIYWIQDFRITEEIAEGLERAGYADSVRDFLGESGSAALEGFDSLAELSEEEIAERLAIPKDPIRYDPLRWRFVPLWEEIEGLEDAEFATLAMLLPLFQRIADEYASKEALPPFPGVLISTNPRASESSAEAFRWRWDPETGILSQGMSHRLQLRYNPLAEFSEERFRFFLPSMTATAGDPNAGEAASLQHSDREDSILRMEAQGSAAGIYSARMLAIFQGSAAI